MLPHQALGACCTGLDTCTDNVYVDDCDGGFYFEQQTCSDIDCPTSYSVDDDGVDDPDAGFSSPVSRARSTPPTTA